MASLEAAAGKMLRKPYFDLAKDQQREQLTLAQRMVRAILQDPELFFRRDAGGVVSLVGGTMDNAGEVMAAAGEVNGYAVDVLRCARAMQLSMRQTVRVPRRCTRNELYEARRALTPYDAVAVRVRGHKGKKLGSAAVSLVDLVREQVSVAQEQGVFTPPKGTNKIAVLVCADTILLWRTAATRCDVFVGVWPRRVGDYAHATARLCNATKNRLQQDVSSWVQEGDCRGVIGRVKDVWGDLMQASENIPKADRVAFRPTKNDTFDLTAARVFLDDIAVLQGHIAI